MKQDMKQMDLLMDLLHTDFKVNAAAPPLTTGAQHAHKRLTMFHATAQPSQQHMMHKSQHTFTCCQHTRYRMPSWQQRL
jgi:hypothetical protein